MNIISRYDAVSTVPSAFAVHSATTELLCVPPGAVNTFGLPIGAAELLRLCDV